MSKTISELLADRIARGVSADLLTNIRFHRYDVEHEEDEPSQARAFYDAYEEAVANNERKLITECRKILIEIGYYMPMTKKQLANTVSTGTPWSFKLGGVPYEWVGKMLE